MPASLAFEQLIELLGDAVDHRNGTQAEVRCPAHDDRRASLSIGVATEGDPGAVIHCQAGCTVEDVLRVIGLETAALYDQWWEHRNGSSPRIVAQYDYTDEDGRLLYQVVRFHPKDFRQRRPDGRGGWTWNLGDTRRVLYRLPQVIAAAAAGRRIWVVEGEKDVAALEAVGEVATCNPGGAGKWRKEYAEVLRGAMVIVVADRDKPGRKHVRQVGASLEGVDVAVVESPSHKDVHAHLAAGAGLDEFVLLPEDADEAPRYAGRHVDLVALLAGPARETPWRVKGVVADGTLTFISAEGGAGKSWVAQAFCEGVHHGESVAGLECAQGVALYVDAEMGSAMFADRLRSSGATGAEYEYIDAVGLDVSRTDDLMWLQGKIKQTGANLVVIDSFRRLTPSKAENDSDDMAPVVGSLAKLARDTGVAIVVIHHKGESEKLFRGSSAIQNQTDALFGLVRFEDDPEGPLRHLWCPVARGAKRPRYSSDAADVWLLIDEDTGAVDEGDSPDLVAHMATTAESVLRQVIEQDIFAALPAKTKSEVAGKVKRRVDDPTFRAVWTELRRSKGLVKESGVWKKGGGAQNPKDPTTTTLFSCSCQTPAEPAPDGRCSRCWGAIPTPDEEAS